MTIGGRRLVRGTTEPVDDADTPVIDLLYISVRLPEQPAAASVLVFDFSSFPLFLAARTPRMAGLVAALVTRSTTPGPFHHRPGSIFLGRCGNKRWATSSFPRTAWRSAAWKPNTEPRKRHVWGSIIKRRRGRGWEMVRDHEAGQSRTLGRCSQYFGFFATMNIGR